MSDYLIKEETLNNLADSVRTVSGESGEMTPDQMILTMNNTKSAIDALDEHINDKNNPHQVNLYQVGDLLYTLRNPGNDWILANGDKINKDLKILRNLADPNYSRFLSKPYKTYNDTVISSQVIKGDNIYAYITTTTSEMTLYASTDLNIWAKQITISASNLTFARLTYCEPIKKWVIVYARKTRSTSNYNYYSFFIRHSDTINSGWSNEISTGVSDMQSSVALDFAGYVNNVYIIACNNNGYTNSYLLSTSDFSTFTKCSMVKSSARLRNIENVIYYNGCYYFATNDGSNQMLLKMQDLSSASFTTLLTHSTANTTVYDAYGCNRIIECNGKYFLTIADGTSRKMYMSSTPEITSSTKFIILPSEITGFSMIYHDNCYIMMYLGRYSSASNCSIYSNSSISYDDFSNSFTTIQLGKAHGSAGINSFIYNDTPYFSFGGNLFEVAQYLPTININDAKVFIKSK